MIVLFTDFGLHGPYLGQVRAVLYERAPAVPVIDLISNAPQFNPRTSAYLLAAYSRSFEPDTVFLAVIDPGVGSNEREAMIVQADGKWFVGPDNGLFNVIAAQAKTISAWHVTTPADVVSPSFHGRDVFAPLAADLSHGKLPDPERLSPTVVTPWAGELEEVIYVDHFGNLITGIRAESLAAGERLSIAGVELLRARTFSDVPKGTPMFYENANGLIEVAVNQGRADRYFNVDIGYPVALIDRDA